MEARSLEARLRELIGPTLTAKLKQRGLLSERGLKFIIASTPDELVEMLSLSGIESAVRLRNAAKNIVGYADAAVTAEELAALDQSTPRLTTGVKSIDELLGGGLRVGDVYEFAGEFGTGKTQLCHQLSVTVQLPRERGGLSGGAVYIDTEGTFSPQRVEAIARRFGVEGALRRVVVYKPLNTGELESFVREVLPGYLEDNAKLVVIDSVIALYRAQYRGIEWLARRQQAINYLLDWLKRWARIYGVAAVITNQVLTHPLPSGVALKLPAGGNIIAHASTHRFIFRKAGDAWMIECLDSPRIAKGASVEFRITDAGVEEA
ncbi:MAG: ATPase domain-containing protein [Thermofilaceae archaeon]